MKLKDAQMMADDLAQRVAPFCERVEIAGSIRRLQSNVKDIELVVVPRFEQRTPEQPDLFGESADTVDLLTEALEAQPDFLADCWEAEAFGPAYKKIRLCDEKQETVIMLDLFSVVGGRQFGLIFMIRTGSGRDPNGREGGFSRGMLSQWKRTTGGGYSQDGVLHLADGTKIATPEEVDVFEACRVSYVPPELRLRASDVDRFAIAPQSS